MFYPYLIIIAADCFLEWCLDKQVQYCNIIQGSPVSCLKDTNSLFIYYLQNMVVRG